MIRLLRASQNRIAMALALALLSAACSGPSVPLELFVKEDPVDITFGEQAEDEVPVDRPAGAETLNPGFPSFVAPPPPLPPRLVTEEDRLTEVTPPPPDPCPAPGTFDTPETLASSQIVAPPREGTYRFRRSGTAKVDGEVVPLHGAVDRQVTNTQTLPTPRGDTWRYDLVQTEVSALSLSTGAGAAAKTTTTYELDPHSTAQPVPAADTERVSGVKIVRIVTESPAGTDAFVPRPAVRILTLPASAKAYAEGASGTDPLTGLSLDVRFRTLERAEVEGCGVVYQAWKQRVEGVYYATASPPDVSGEGLWFTSTLYFATQFGGLVLKDELHLSDQRPVDPAAEQWELPAGQKVDVQSVTTIKSVEPRSGP